MGGAVDIELPDGLGEAQTQSQRLNDAAMAIVEANPDDGLLTALSMLRRAISLRPHQAEVHCNMGLVLWRLRRTAEAERALRYAIDLEPDRASYHANIGVFLGGIGKPAEAELYLREASRLDPDNLTAVWDLALLYLRNNDWQNGLELYDIRRQHRGPKFYPDLGPPLWKGESLDGKTLFIQGEQGVGDRFLFARYFQWIKDTWPSCTIIACLYDPMTPLFWEYRHLVELRPLGVPFPDDVDYTCFLCSLPGIHGSTLDNVPPDPGLLRKRIEIARKDTRCNLPQPNLPALKIGLCWTGNPEQIRNHDRTIPLTSLIPFAEDTRLAFYSFQCSPGSKDLHRHSAGDLICDLGPGIEKEGWVGTGIALMEMDLMLTVCTSVAHLAGALGVPCWTMLCADPYWIWGRDGTTTPWYPSMTLYRQKVFGDWSDVLIDVKAALSKLADERIDGTRS